MRNTSLEAYQKILESGVLPQCRLEIYRILFDHGPLTQNEVEERLIDRTGAERKSRSGHKRFSELERQGAIAIVGERPCAVTGMNCKVWDVTANVPHPLPKSPALRQKLLDALKEIARLKHENARLEKEISVIENDPVYKQAEQQQINFSDSFFR